MKRRTARNAGASAVRFPAFCACKGRKRFGFRGFFELGVIELRVKTALMIILTCLLLASCRLTAERGSEQGVSSEAGRAESTAESADTSAGESAAGTESPDAAQSQGSADLPVKDSCMLDVPLICQYPELPTGCESVAATMLLNYYGVDVSATVFAGEWLECEPYYYENGVMYGPSPYDRFVGDPFSSHSYGCFATVIANAINANCSEVSANPLYNVPFGDLLERISKGEPVLIWATMHMQEPMQGATWTLPNGELLHWKRGEHCLVLVGYDKDFVYLNDPDSGACAGYEKELVALRYEQMGSWALEIVKSNG